MSDNKSMSWLRRLGAAVRNPRAIAVGVLLVSATSLTMGQSVADYWKQATDRFPALVQTGSPLHSKFTELYNTTLNENPALLKNPAWPVLLAQRASAIIAKPLEPGAANIQMAPLPKPPVAAGNGDKLLPASMRGRMAGGRQLAMDQNKMKATTEQAVLRGLGWLQQNQNADGSWGDTNKGAMTGFALLCFLGHGETPDSPAYGANVKKAVDWIIEKGTASEGRLSMAKAFNASGVYEHGICTFALGEYYAMTRDERVVPLLKQAITYILQGQGPEGGWMYAYDRSANDLSISGWQIQALKAAHLGHLDVPGVDKALDKAIRCVDTHKGRKGGYGYRGPDDRYSLTGVGIFCRLLWKDQRGEVRKGVDWLLDETKNAKPVNFKGGDADLYAWYYHTQACFMFGGNAWDKWNQWFQDEICNAQSPDGSWPIPGGKVNGPAYQATKTGAVYRTALCILMLEVFYRY